MNANRIGATYSEVFEATKRECLVDGMSLQEWNQRLTQSKVLLRSVGFDRAEDVRRIAMACGRFC